MPLPSTKRLGISALKKGAATYQQVIKKRETEEAIIEEAQAAQAAQAARTTPPPLDFSTVGAARLQLQRLLTQIEAHAREVKEESQRRSKDCDALVKNTDAWIQNLSLRKPHEPLEPFVMKDGTTIESFPETAFSILIMDDDSLTGLLIKLDLDLEGSRAQMIWRVANHVGIGCWMRGFFEHHLGEKCEAYSMADLDTVMESEPEEYWAQAERGEREAWEDMDMDEFVEAEGHMPAHLDADDNSDFTSDHMPRQFRDMNLYEEDQEEGSDSDETM